MSSDTWGTVYSLERAKATGHDPDNLCAEIDGNVTLDEPDTRALIC